MVIGQSVPLSRQNDPVNMVFADFTTGAGVRHAEHASDVTLIMIRDEEPPHTCRGFSERGAARGVIAPLPARNDRQVSCLTEVAIPLNVHGRASEVTRPSTWRDVNKGRAIHTLTKLGHRQLSRVNGLDFASRRQQDYVRARTEAGLPHDTVPTLSQDLSELYDHDAAAARLSLRDLLTAFVTSAVMPTLGIKRAIDACVPRIGHDVAVVCHDDDPSCLPGAGATPLFKVMPSSVRAAGARYPGLVIERSAAPDAPLPTKWQAADMVMGTSTAPPAKR